MPMYSACGNAALPALGFPIRESTDHRLFSAYPWLIAAVHALHRLLVPRHPPCALPILTVIADIDSAARGRRGSTTTKELYGRSQELGDTRKCWQNCAVFKDRARGRRRDSPSVSQ